jgi:hypothetical protein
MMTPDAIETNGHNFAPTIVHTERDMCRIERLPGHLFGSRDGALSHAERIIAGRAASSYAQRMIDRRSRLGL